MRFQRWMSHSRFVVNRTVLIGVCFVLLAGACGQTAQPDSIAGGSTQPTGTVAPAATNPSDQPIPTAALLAEISADRPRVEPSAAGTAQMAELAAGVNRFALDLYHAVDEQGDGNLIYSPSSIALAFSMVYAGARGETEAQMATVLGFLPQESHHPAANALERYLTTLGSGAPAAGEGQGEAFRLNIANAVWGQRGLPFEDAYLQALAAHYGAGVRTADFAANPEGSRQAVNAWVTDRTAGRIEDALPPGAIDPLTRLVLANAIYFKAAWLFPFEADATVDGPFTLLDGSQVTVPLMRRGTARMPYAGGDGYQSVVLPYVGDSVEMVVIVPQAGRFEEIDAGLSAGFLTRVRATSETRDVTLTMPRFAFESDLDLASLLSDMGMPAPFGPADFSGISRDADLSISAALHRATIAVDEQGTEATAATAIAMPTSAMQTAQLTIDRPFIFAIVERETGAILFLGRVTNAAA
jgi:serpin B